MSDRCRSCGRFLGAGYLCDNCDEVTIHEEPPETVGDLDADTRVWVASNIHGSQVKVHLQPNCRGVGVGVRPTTAAEQFDDSEICSYCNNTWSNTGTEETPLCKQYEGAWADD